MLSTYVISDLNEEIVTGTFCKKQFQQRNQKEFRVEKEKLINYMLIGN